EAKEGLAQPQTDPRNTDDKLVTEIASNIPDGHDQPAEPIMSVGDTDSTSAIPEGHDQPAAPIVNVGDTMDTDSTSATPEGYDHPTKELANTDEKLGTDSASKVLEGQSRPAESPASAVDQEKEDHPHTDFHVDESRHHYFTRSKRKRSNSAAESDEHVNKIARAMLAALLDCDDEEIDLAFPAEVIAGVRIPRTHAEAIADPEHGNHWRGGNDQ
ncbi:hypothetical protein E4U37_006319, partial [Claviceps purpurea]